VSEANHYAIRKFPKTDEEGHVAVLVEPKNCTTKKVKQGKTDIIYFEKPDYVTIGDPYKKPVDDNPTGYRMNLRPNVHDGHKKLHDIAFKPAKHVIERYYRASYEHMNDRVEVKKDYKDADGNVITAPKNFVTMPPKIGLHGQVGKNVFFNKQVEHIPDDYNWPKKLAR